MNSILSLFYKKTIDLVETKLDCGCIVYNVNVNGYPLKNSETKDIDEAHRKYAEALEFKGKTSRVIKSTVIK